MSSPQELLSPENLRHIILKCGSRVTVGDIVAETGCLAEEAQAALDKMMESYESILRVNESGDLIYLFNPSMLERDHRSWWQKHRRSVGHGFRTAIKIILTIILLAYFIAFYIHFLFFIIALAVILAVIARNPFNILHFIAAPFVLIAMAFGKDEDDDPAKPKPFHASFYDFIFGPEHIEKEQNLKQQAASLIRAKQGVITLDDWIVAAGRSREQAESDLARFTAEFEGKAVITKSGHIVYAFKELAKTTKKSVQPQEIPHIWNELREEPKFTGNTFEKNFFVFGFAAFNILMAYFFMPCTVPELFTIDFTAMFSLYEIQDVILGIIPFILNAVIFAIPILRAPYYFYKCRKARKENLYRLAMQSTLEYTPPEFSSKPLLKARYTEILRQHHICGSGNFESTMKRIQHDLNLDEKVAKDGDIYYNFSALLDQQRDAGNLRRSLDHEKLIVDRQKAAFSTDNREQTEIETREFDKKLADAEGGSPRYASHTDPPSDEFLRSQSPEIREACAPEHQEDLHRVSVRRPPEIENDTAYSASYGTGCNPSYDDNRENCARSYEKAKRRAVRNRKPKTW